MLYLIAILLPPLAILMSGKPFQAILALILQITVIGWLPATIWALFVANNHYADQRTKRVIEATRQAAEQQAAATRALAAQQAAAAALAEPQPPAR